MSDTRIDPEFSRALRSALIERVERRRRIVHVWLGVGVIAGLGLAGTAAATAAYLIEPGGTALAELDRPTVETHIGPATIELGAPPEGATHVRMELWCLSSGTFVFDDGAAMSCTDSDAGTPAGWSSYSLPIATGTTGTTITAPDDAEWRISVAYTSEHSTQWAENARGETYGVANERGTPDLVAVIATNGAEGYVYADELADADGSAAAERFSTPEEALAWQQAHEGRAVVVPVYDNDGETRIGEFIVAPEPTPAQG
ncbi:peptidase M56 family protein [Agromyces sp. NPDC056379]|uniref:peptidase M56 family protein n=1 Tax=unclassified Agromyces TaxID=2639701 RepID=UPI0035D86924